MSPNAPLQLTHARIKLLIADDRWIVREPVARQPAHLRLERRREKAAACDALRPRVPGAMQVQLRNPVQETNRGRARREPQDGEHVPEADPRQAQAEDQRGDHPVRDRTPPRAPLSGGAATASEKSYRSVGRTLTNPVGLVPAPIRCESRRGSGPRPHNDARARRCTPTT